MFWFENADAFEAKVLSETTALVSLIQTAYLSAIYMFCN